MGYAHSQLRISTSFLCLEGHFQDRRPLLHTWSIGSTADKPTLDGNLLQHLVPHVCDGCPSADNAGTFVIHARLLNGPAMLLAII